MNNPAYTIKWLEETAWAVGIAVVVLLLTTLTGIESVTDWKTWIVGVGTASVRIAAATALNQFRKLGSGGTA